MWLLKQGREVKLSGARISTCRAWKRLADQGWRAPLCQDGVRIVLPFAATFSDEEALPVPTRRGGGRVASAVKRLRSPKQRRHPTAPLLNGTGSLFVSAFAAGVQLPLPFGHFRWEFALRPGDDAAAFAEGGAPPACPVPSSSGYACCGEELLPAPLRPSAAPSCSAVVRPAGRHVLAEPICRTTKRTGPFAYARPVLTMSHCLADVCSFRLPATESVARLLRMRGIDPERLDIRRRAVYTFHDRCLPLSDVAERHGLFRAPSFSRTARCLLVCFTVPG